jgi:hypothetical protein
MSFKLPESEAQSRQKPIREDIQFQRYSWLSERLSWVGIAFAIAVAIAGGFGDSGLLFAENVAGNDPVVAYEPLVRRQAPAELRIDTSSSRIKFSPGFQDYLDIEWVMPPPESVSQDDGITYNFAPSPTVGRQQIILAYKPKTAGWFDGEITAGAGGSVRFRQFAYP